MAPAPPSARSVAPPPVNTVTNWRKGELLGSGAYGQVFLGLNTENGQLLAVKQVNLSRERTRTSDALISALEAEINLMSGLVHDNIVRYIGSQRSDLHLNIFLEFVSGGSISSLLKKFGRFSEKLVRVYVKQILAGLEYLHQNKIIHRDIKGANILITQEGTCKLGTQKKVRGAPIVREYMVFG
jgi:serine/threonine protein kinase